MSVTTPYYEDDHVTIFHADCSLISEWLVDGEVLVTDPPYGIDYHSNSRRATLPRSIEGDKDTRLRDNVLDWWGERPALVFGTWRIPRPSATRALLVWDTKGALGMGAMDLPWKPAHQEVYVIGSGFTGARTTDVLRHAPVQSMASNGRLHPHQKPVELLEELIAKCPPGVIVDPFMGVGSTLVAARACGRRAIGVEVNERYCALAVERLGGPPAFADDSLFGAVAASADAGK